LHPELYDFALMGLSFEGGVGRWSVLGAGAFNSVLAPRAIRFRPEGALHWRFIQSLWTSGGRYGTATVVGLKEKAGKNWEITVRLEFQRVY
jgi:hypothetical protein